MPKCAFCEQNAKLTGEHLFADWIGRLLADSTDGHVEFATVDPKTHEVRRWSSPRLGHTLNCVCAECNNGWMSDIDEAASSVLKGILRYEAPVSFLQSGVHAIAAFTLKNAFVADFDSERPFFSPHDRRQFKETLQFPRGVHMWLAGITLAMRERSGIYRAVYRKPPSYLANGMEVYVFTWSVENVLLQLAAVRWANVLTRSRRGSPRISQDASLDETMIPFWPPRKGRLGWPPKFYISHTILEDVPVRFNKFVYRRK